MATARLRRPRTSRMAGVGVKLAAAVATVVLLVLGVWATGAVITDDFSLAMVLTTAWIAAVGLASVALFFLRRDLGAPVLVAYLLAGGVIGAYLGRSILFDDEVDEQVVTAASPPASQEGRAGPADGPQRNALVSEGGFEPLEHQATGTASVVALGEGGQVLTLTDFEVDNGPDLRVYLVAGDPRDEGDVEDFVDLGALKGNQGDQQYEIPSSVDVRRYSTAVIWCRAFSVAFARAPLEG